ncbi:hypothetical protein ABBQ38_006842 [Trebouxia sp. C0009 RCD-2024]
MALFSGQAGRLDKPASSFAEFLQTEAGKQQLAAGAGSVISLALGVKLMGLSRYGRQLLVRPIFVQLKDRILQLQEASGTADDKMMIISGTPGVGKSFCALYMASYWIAQGTRVIYEFHEHEAASIVWYHFPPCSGECFRTDLKQDVRNEVAGATDGDTVYIVDGGLPMVSASSCWCYAFSSPQKSVYRYKRKVPSCHLLFLPLWTLEELQQCRASVDLFSSNVTAESVELAFEFAGGLPRTVLQLPAHKASSSIDIRSLIVDELELAVNLLPSSQALQDTVNQIRTVGYQNGSESIFHMLRHDLFEHGHPRIVFATQFAAQVVFYKLGQVARYRQLDYFDGAAAHAHWQGARGYWFEKLAHQVLANGGNHTFKLVGSDTLYTLALPRATFFGFRTFQELAGTFVADSMDVYAQQRHSNFPTFDALNCGSLWFQVTVAKKHFEFMEGFRALKAAALPRCNLNKFVHPPLHDNSKPIHMIVTTPDRFDTCYLKQRQSSPLFQRGVMKLDFSSAFGQLQLRLGDSATGLEGLEAMAIDSAIED